MNVRECRSRIADQDASLAHRYWAREGIESIIADRVNFFDGLIREIWASHFNDPARDALALFAVGGYARK